MHVLWDVLCRDRGNGVNYFIWGDVMQPDFTCPAYGPVWLRKEKAMASRVLLEKATREFYDKVGTSVCIDLEIWIHKPVFGGTEDPQVAYCLWDEVMKKNIRFKTYLDLVQYIKNYGRDEILFRKFG